MIWNFILDHIPWWGWVIIIGLPTGAALYFFSPILIPLWNMLPRPIKTGLILIGSGFVAFMGGRYRGRANAEEEERRRNAEALQKRAEVDREVDRMSDDEADKKLRD